MSDTAEGYKKYTLPIFEIDIEAMHEIGRPGGAYLTVGQASYFNLSGNYTQVKSTLAPAIVEYDISVTDRQIQLTRQERTIAVANNTEGVTLAEIKDHVLPGTLETLVQFLNMVSTGVQHPLSNSIIADQIPRSSFIPMPVQ